MTRTTSSLRSICIACATVLAGSSAMAFDFGANIELDNTHRQGSGVAGGDKGLSQSGRVELGVSNKTDEGLWVAAKTAFLSKKDGTLATDDMWVQLGKGMFDVKLGRFEATNLFPLANDTLVNHAGSFNVANAGVLRGRKAGDVFHAAGTLNFGSGFGLELGVVDTTNNTVVGSGSKGTRTVLTYSNGPLAFAAGVESGEYTNTNRVSGTGVTGSYDFGGFKLTANIANGKTDAQMNQQAVALSAAAGNLGLGYVSAKNDLSTGGDQTVNTTYLSYKIDLVKNASVTPAISHSTARLAVGAASVDETALRVRLNYTF